ncbi:MAG: hypothetical protein MHM6MM_005223 [Cercozoa sp. M6MM]
MSVDLVLLRQKKKQQKQLEEFERQKQEIESQKNARKQRAGQVSFTTQMTADGDPVLQAGLLTADDYRRRQKQLQLKETARAKLKQSALQRKREKHAEKKRRREQKLAFNDDDEEEDFIFPKKGKNKAKAKRAQIVDESDESSSNSDEPQRKKARKVKKNPHVATWHLPDREREAQLRAEKRRLEEEWEKRQEELKESAINITFSYWDGSGHRRETQVKRGASVHTLLGQSTFRLSSLRVCVCVCVCLGQSLMQFLHVAVVEQFAREFPDLFGRSPDDLLFVKEDIIVPNRITFHELILTRARGKTGPLFHFDAVDDVRVSHSAPQRNVASHAAKVVTRHWYDKNKHIYPASRWEVFDPKKYL